MNQNDLNRVGGGATGEVVRRVRRLDVTVLIVAAVPAADRAIASHSSGSGSRAAQDRFVRTGPEQS